MTRARRLVVTICPREPGVVTLPVERGGEVVTVFDVKGKKEVQLRAGKYHIRIEGRADVEVVDGSDYDLKRGDRVARPARKAGRLPIGRRHGNAAKVKNEHKKANWQNFPKVWAISHLVRLFCR